MSGPEDAPMDEERAWGCSECKGTVRFDDDEQEW